MLKQYILRDGSGIIAQAEQLKETYSYYDESGMHTAKPGDYCLLYDNPQGGKLNIYCDRADFEKAFAPMDLPIAGAA